MTYQETESLKKLAQSWNTLDTRFIETELAENFIYKSQWVLTPIEGSKVFLSYLQSKFEAIKTAMQNGVMSVSAEIASCYSTQTNYCAYTNYRQWCKAGINTCKNKKRKNKPY